MAQPSAHGRFIWQELLTADAAAAGAFYSRVIGWRTQPFPNPDSNYSIFLAQSGPVGGFSRLPEDGREGGARSHWLPYIGADDVDATAAAAERLGGKALRPGTNIENVGRYAVLADPQGAVFGIYKPQQARGSAAKSHPQPGEFAWQELASSDHEAAFQFYAELFGWQALRRVQMGPSGTYLVFGRDGVQCGGMYKPSGSSSASHWLSYIEVANVDSLVTHARAAGGDVVTGPMDVPGGSRIAQLRDSAGVLFAVVTTQKSVAEPKAPSKPSAPAKAKARSSTAALAPATTRALSPAAAKQSTARQPAVRTGASRGSAAGKAAAKKGAPRTASKKAAAKKTAARKTAAKKATARKPRAKRAPRSSRSSSPQRRAGSAAARGMPKQRKSAAKSGRAKRSGAAKGARGAAHSTRRGAGRTGRRKK